MSKDSKKVAEEVEEIKLEDEVKETPECVIVEKVELDVKEVKISEPVSEEVVVADVADVANVANVVVTTAIKEEPTVVTGLKLVSESSLSDDQKKIATQIYVTSEVAVKGIMSDASLHNSVKVTMMVGQVIKDLTHVKVGDHAPSGSDKKAVALEVGRILIKEHVSEEAHQKEIATIYDHVAEKTLEAMIDVSKTINAVVSKAAAAAVEEAATQCCPGLLSFFKKSA